MVAIRRILAVLGILPGALLCLLGGCSAAMTLLDQFFSDFIDLTNFNIINLFNPFTSVGGSGSFLDSLVAGPGASGGSAIRYWLFMAYGLIAAAGFGIVKSCWNELKK